MALDERLLHEARDAGARLADAEHRADVAKANYYHAIRMLHITGASLREIAEALAVSHQRVHQIIDAAGGAKRWRPRRKARADLACTFCGSAKDTVGRLVAGPNLFICDACVVLARRAIAGTSRRAGLARLPRTGTFTCSFCGRSQGQADALVGGPGVYICDQCILLCEEIIGATPGQPS